jgi:hypothetical protein
MIRFATILAISLLAGCGVAKSSDAAAEKQVNAMRPIPIPDDLALVTIFDSEARAMSEQVRSEGGNAEIETYNVVRNSKCSELASVGGVTRRISCEYESTIEFSPILADGSDIRVIMKDNSREWTKANSVLQQNGENWKVQPPQIN